jgi:hypothetical protein
MCGEPATPGKTLCKRHQAERGAYFRDRYKKMRDAYLKMKKGA